eukprot:751577-Hanusia_phi.AAC.2
MPATRRPHPPSPKLTLNAGQLAYLQANAGNFQRRAPHQFRGGMLAPHKVEVVADGKTLLANVTAAVIRRQAAARQSEETHGEAETKVAVPASENLVAHAVMRKSMMERSGSYTDVTDCITSLSDRSQLS